MLKDIIKLYGREAACGKSLKLSAMHSQLLKYKKKRTNDVFVKYNKPATDYTEVNLIFVFQRFSLSWK